MASNYLSISNLRDLYENSLIVRVVQTTTRKIQLRSMSSTSIAIPSTPIKQKRPLIEDNPVTPAPKISRVERESDFSPDTNKFINSLTPASQSRMIRDLRLDDLKLRSLNIYEEDIDPDYEQFNPSIVGSDLELWVCVHLPCPICGGELYKYGNQNMPVIDVVCSNDHTNYSRYFQIKAKQYNSGGVGQYSYFSYSGNYITTGSIRCGFNAHNLSANSPIDDKKLLVNYMCIIYHLNEANKISIDTRRSFFVFPNLNTTSTDTNNYYTYLENTPKPIIKPNLELCDRYTFVEKYSDLPIFRLIELNYYFDTFNVNIRSVSQLSFKMKYLVMKKKYIDLKKSLDNYLI